MIDRHALPPFPAAGNAPPPLSADLLERAIAMSPAAAADIPALMALHAASRAAELVHAPWTDAEKRAVLDSQFRLQHTHYTRHYPKADFWLVLAPDPDGTPRMIGRLYADRSRRDWHVIELTLATEAQGGGLGSALLQWLQLSAVDAGAQGLGLSAAVTNPRAQALYRRLGFTERGPIEGMAQPMIWRP